MDTKPRIRQGNYFVFLLPLFFVLHGYVENHTTIPAADAIGLALFYLALAGVLILLFRWILRSWRKAGLFTFGLLCLQFFFGPLHDFLKGIAGGTFLVRYAFLIPVSVVVLIAFYVYLRRSGSKFSRFAAYANVLLIVFLLLDVAKLMFYPTPAPGGQPLPADFRNCDSCTRPDIYLIIADEYAGKEELLEIFHYDNSRFETALQQRGFHVVKSPKSNYNSTPFSMASLLDMQYLKGIERSYNNKAGLDKAYSVINRNQSLAFLKQQGYKFRNYSVFNLDNEPPLRVQHLLVTGVGLITTQTFTSRLNRDIAFNLVTKLNIGFLRDKVLQEDLHNNEFFLRKLKEEAADTTSSAPRFVYTHLMMPHYPFYYDSSGRRNQLEVHLPADDSTRQKLYLGYLQYANGLLLDLIDHIRQRSKKPPVIILMSDHGFREFIGPAERKYHFMTLNSIYLPNANYGGFYEGMSNVNQFRTIFNAQLGQALPLLPDSTSYLEN